MVLRATKLNPLGLSFLIFRMGRILPVLTGVVGAGDHRPWAHRLGLGGFHRAKKGCQAVGAAELKIKVGCGGLGTGYCFQISDGLGGERQQGGSAQGGSMWPAFN